MASWMIHLRVAEKLLATLQIQNERAFVMGNIAPDSGKLNKDGTGYIPSAEVSHFMRPDKDGIKDIDEQKFVTRYFTKQLRDSYSTEERAFYLGYFTHLLTDKLWVRDIVYPAKNQFCTLYTKDKGAFFTKIKKDWYDLDALFLREHPDFRTFGIFESTQNFTNSYVAFFSETAFIEQKAFIVDFYKKAAQTVEPSERKMYLSQDDLQTFVDTAATEIRKEIKALTGAEINF